MAKGKDPDTVVNGSADVLADAMRTVFKDIGNGIADLKHDISDVKTEIGEMESRLNDRIDTTNENVQAQLAEQNESFNKRMKAHESKIQDSIKSLSQQPSKAKSSKRSTPRKGASA